MNTYKNFKDYYKTTKEKIEQKIKIFNSELIDDDNGLMKKSLEQFCQLNSEGKIIRGVLVNLGFYLLKDDSDYSLDLSLAYEVFQTAILIHDDIIDNDNTRRGKNTIHYENYNDFIKHGEEQECKHLANSTAICLGDYGLYKANQIIAEKYCKDKNLAKVLINFNNTVLTTIKGEFVDTVLPFKVKHNLINKKDIESTILEIYRKKTSHYTIIGPLSVGLLLAGCEEEKIKDIEDFATKVGIAFQIQDDILGIYSNETGKVQGTDIKEFKQTILYSHILNTPYKDELKKYYGDSNISEENIIKVQELFRKSKSYEYAINMMNSMYNESIELLNNINWISEDKKNILRGFVEYLRNRDK